MLSYQRRIHAVKHHFFKRGKRTPLGRMSDWWAQRWNSLCTCDACLADKHCMTKAANAGTWNVQNYLFRNERQTLKLCLNC